MLAVISGKLVDVAVVAVGTRLRTRSAIARAPSGGV
jgi:hypothetical protein